MKSSPYTTLSCRNLFLILVVTLTAPLSAATYPSGVQVGTVSSGLIIEASGLAASSRNPGVLWTHNDAGHPAQIFAVTTAGAFRGTFNIPGAGATDYEDIAVGPGPTPDLSYLYVGDIGDNDLVRSSIHVYRIAEPSVATSGPFVTDNLSFEDITFVYPNSERRNAESLMIDPLSGDIFIATKQNSVTRFYRAAFPQSTSSPITLEFLKEVAGIHRATGGSISPDGKTMIVRNLTGAYQWIRPDGGTWSDALQPAPLPVSLISETQGEAIAFAAPGATPGFYTTSEETNQPVYFYAAVPEPASFGIMLVLDILFQRRFK
jgi:hypothetical protein